TFKMTINYKKFMKHAEILVKGTKHLGSRPILEGVWHSEKGDKLAVTDSHYGYFAKNANAPKDTVIHAVTGEKIEGKYPDFERLLRSVHDSEQTLVIESVTRLIEVIQAMQYSVSKGVRRRETQLKLENGKLHVVQDIHDENK